MSHLLAFRIAFRIYSRSRIRPMYLPPSHKSIVYKTSSMHQSYTAVMLQKQHANEPIHLTAQLDVQNNGCVNSDYKQEDVYRATIRDLNSLQSNVVSIAVAKTKHPEERFELFKKHLDIAGIQIDDLKRLNVIHVSGTKGKGSTCAFTESILRSHGLKTGFYNSPHLTQVLERIRINGDPVSIDKFCKHFKPLFARLKAGTERDNIPMPAYFAFLTILAFRTFIEEQVHVAVLEVGIGGEYDITNVVADPVVCGITSLDYDHTSVLGDTIEEIAWHKAGIIKKNAPVFTVHQCDEAMNVIRRRAQEKSSNLIICPPLESYGLDKINLGIDGPAQQSNASLAIQISQYWLETQRSYTRKHQVPFIRNEATLKGLSNCRWKGRCQVIKLGSLVFFLDGAHTRDSMRYCRDWFINKSYKSENKNKIARYLLMNIIGDRPRDQLMKILVDLDWDLAVFSTNKADFIETATSDNATVNGDTSSMQTKHNADVWRQLSDAPVQIREAVCVKEAIKIIHDCSDSSNFESRQHHILVTGSLHLVGTVLGVLEQMLYDLSMSKK
ncbi:Folylpolyglutamate synthase, mitochondrial, partial [Fragariocoptes setiger]